MFIIVLRYFTKFLWEQDMVKTLDEFEKGRIAILRFGAQVVIDVFDVLHCGAKNAPFLFFFAITLSKRIIFP